MSSENVKIVINEYDLTTAAGRGTDSTDIAFVPGFSAKLGAPTVPVMCTSVEEFEQLFGKAPYYLSSADMGSVDTQCGNAGDPDKSYIYAKELLNQGMPVVYYACELDLENAVFIDPTTKNPYDESAKTPETYTVEAGEKNTLVIKTTDKHEESTDIIIYATVSPKSDTVNLLCDDASIKLSRVSKTDTKYMQYTDSCVTAEEDVGVEITLRLKALQEFTLSIKTPKTSCFTRFYTGANGNGGISDVLTSLEDRNEFSVKYITSGGYPAMTGKVASSVFTMTDELGAKMLSAAEARGDAVALVDYMADNTTDIKSIYDAINTQFRTLGKEGSFGTAMYPWGYYNCSFSLPGARVLMPASFGYLMCVADAIKTSPNWLAMAGVSRGIVPNLVSLHLKGSLTNSLAEHMQPKFGTEDNKVSINSITNIRPYGLTLWGNRTLMPVGADGCVALNFLNTRNMINDIKKLLYVTAKSLMFEQDSDSLWLRFKSGVSPLLNQMKSGNGISDYKIIKGTTKYNGDPLTKGEISATIKVFPLYAVEYFELNVEISDQDVTVS